MKRTSPLLFLMITAPLFAQPSNPPIVLVTAVPSGACANGLPDRQVSLDRNPSIPVRPQPGGALPAVGTVTVGSTTISGGTTGGLLYNNAGVLGNSAADTITSTGAATFGAAGAASTPGVSITGAPYTAGNTTTNTPQLYMNRGAAPTNWSINGTEFGINAPSGYGGQFLDFRVNGGNSIFTVSSTGNETLAANLVSSGNNSVFGASTGIAAVLGVVPTSSCSGTVSSANGRVFQIQGGTINRTADTGTIAVSAVNSIGQPTLQAGAASVYTISANLYSAGAPIASTNVTQTAAYDFYALGNNRFDQTYTRAVVSVGTKFTTSGCSVSSTTGGASAGKFHSRGEHVLCRHYHEWSYRPDCAERVVLLP